MRTSLSVLEILVAVADAGSIGAASRELGISQPSASTALQRVERRIGLELIDRSPTGSKLTDCGATVADWAREVLAASDRLEAGVAALRRSQASHLTIAASMTVAEYLLPSWLLEFRTASADTHVSLIVQNSHEVADSVCAGRAEFGFVEGVDVDERLEHVTVATDELCFFVSSTHELANVRGPIDIEQLQGLPLVVREVGSGTRAALERSARTAGVRLDPALELGSTAAVRSTVGQGTGVGVLSRLALAEDFASKRLVGLEVDGINLRRRLRLVWRRKTQLAGASADFARMVTRARN